MQKLKQLPFRVWLSWELTGGSHAKVKTMSFKLNRYNWKINLIFPKFRGCNVPTFHLSSIKIRCFKSWINTVLRELRSNVYIRIHKIFRIFIVWYNGSYQLIKQVIYLSSIYNNLFALFFLFNTVTHSIPNLLFHYKHHWSKTNHLKIWACISYWLYTKTTFLSF